MTDLVDEPWRARRGGVGGAGGPPPWGARAARAGDPRLSDGTSVLLARVRTAPEDGRANDALCALIAKTLDASVSRVRLAAGAKSRLKQVAVTGDSETLIARLRAL